MIIFDRESYTPLAVREDSNGNLWLKAKCAEAIQAKSPAVIQAASCGWRAVDISSCTASGAWVYVGFSLATTSTADYTYFQIGGYASQCVFAASVAATANIGVRWSSVSMNSAAASTSSSLLMEGGVFGVYATTDSSSTTHDIFLFGQMVQNIQAT
jgi:hypothetical protein